MGHSSTLALDPLGYVDGMTRYEYVGSHPTSGVDPLGLYEIDVHFLMTYYIAGKCGFLDYDSPYKDEHGKAYSEALVIAFANQYTDINARTQPLAGTNVRATYHFRTTAAGRVVAGSQEAAAVVNAALAAGNPMLLGIGLHAFQDSYSHAGYEPGRGHLIAPEGGHAPDYPFRDVNKAMEMAKATYDRLDEYSRKHHKCPCKVSWEDLKKDIENLLRQGGTEAERQRRWADFVGARLGGAPPFPAVGATGALAPPATGPATRPATAPASRPAASLYEGFMGALPLVPGPGAGNAAATRPVGGG